MSTKQGFESAALRARLKHPVIDSDGHWVEFGPDLMDYLKEVGGSRAADGFKNRPYEGWHLTVPLKERRERRLDQPIWWGVPTRNTLDRATAMLPKLLYQRMDELGMDFAVLYPTAALRIPFIADEETRKATCRAFNRYSAEQFREFRDRLTPVAMIPMHTPAEAIVELEYAVKTLGLKVAMMPSLLRRPIRAAVGPGGEPNPYAQWLDMLALDSEHDYDPVWAKCLELGIAPTFHTVSKGVGTRISPSNAVYNHIGHFGVAGEAICKALFLGGVTRRFPKLKFAFLEGGVGWAWGLYSDLIGHWKKRNPKALEDIDPANLNRDMLTHLFQSYGGKALADKLERWKPEGEAYSPRTADPDASLDDFEACAIERAEQIRDLFIPNFYFGCEADDPANASAFNIRANPYGARLNAIFGSDIGHFDVPDMTKVLTEAWELVDEELISESDFRDFVFANPVRLWAANNPDFFNGTVVEQQARTLLAAI
ncbi:MAG TPA: amidohydrolase family protein [Candidatus Binataceae bacterium]|jgi:predicted TIM-barrel fold metal-dependent hydrolase|nr:amidohydrolase family protein [Candidatus Binataceae bacterium]